METTNNTATLFCSTAAGQSSQLFLEHVLSPLERAALAAGFGAFSYPINGLHLRISSTVAQNLRHICELRLLLAQQLAGQAQALCQEAGADYAPFLSTPVEQLGLSTRLHNLLLSAGCHSLLEVARLGAQGFARRRGVGPQALRELRGVFVRAGFAELFE